MLKLFSTPRQSRTCVLDPALCGPREECLLKKESLRSYFTSTDRNIKEYYSCECKEGFYRNASDCNDLDECQLNIHACHKSTTCRNEVGGYHCDCR